MESPPRISANPEIFMICKGQPRFVTTLSTLPYSPERKVRSVGIKVGTNSSLTPQRAHL